MCRDWAISIRQACRALNFDRSTYHYTSRRADQAGLERRIREICETRVRYGYRRVHVLLEREGWGTNIKRTYRIYRDLGLQLRNKTPKRRVKAKLREDRQKAVEPNDVWAMDFVHDQLATGKKLRVLTVVDTFSRYVPVLDPRHSYRGEDVVETLERVCRQVGYPKTIRVDQGTEFVSRDLDLWAYAKGVTLDFSRPGKPTDNAFIEAFNGRFRAECLNQHWFLTLADAREKMEDWRRDLYEAGFVNPWQCLPKSSSQFLFEVCNRLAALAPLVPPLVSGRSFAPDHNPDSWWPDVCMEARYQTTTRRMIALSTHGSRTCRQLPVGR